MKYISTHYVKIVILQLLYSFQEDLFGMLGQYARMATAILSHISGNIIMALLAFPNRQLCWIPVGSDPLLHSCSTWPK